MDIFIEIIPFVVKMGFGLWLLYWLLSSLQDKYLKHLQDIAVMSRPVQKKEPSLLKLQIQAYERLTLMMDRLGFVKLIRRIKVDGMSAIDFKLALFVAIAQEYDHNITQQIYVSEKLWDVLGLARHQIMAILEEATTLLDKEADARDLELAIYDKVGALSGEPAQVAKQAIATEARTVIGI